MKRKLQLIVYLIIGVMSLKAQSQSTYTWKTANSGGYTYRFVTNDPTKSRFYTLKNGLTVILSQNNKDPEIAFRMAVRAGSNTDPKNNTGLAHYLEHLLFKGTSKYGTLDFAKEKPFLDKIESLYETYNKTIDPEKRKQIYREIDRTSVEASSYSIANEYDKMMTSIGSKGTNAHTAVEETVYQETFPSNAIDKFLAIQAERFRDPVFRIFHTELEAVYEEKNRALDDDGRKMYEGMLKALFPTHNYGLQSVIGTVEHLKNPSLKEIRNYYEKYYIPNNMALIMSGDINFDELIKKIDGSFSYMKSKPLSLYNPQPEKKLTKIQEVNINGPSAENLYIAYRGFPQNSRESIMLSLISRILSNGKAGLIDINLNKQQRVLRASANYNQMKDYGVFILSTAPKAGQSLQQAREAVLEQLDALKKGSFDAELIKATVANSKLRELQSYDSNDSRAEAATEAFIANRGTEWEKSLATTDAMARITKKEVVDFANRFFLDNYVVVMKHKGEDNAIAKVEKPSITPIKTNSNETSEFVRSILEVPLKPITPKFLDYKKDLSQGKVGPAEVLYVNNAENGIFRMTYRWDMGAYNSKLLPIAAQYLSFLNTDKYSAEELSKAFYDIACNYSINVGSDVTTLSISGLQENFTKAVSLVENLLTNCIANEKALLDLKGRLLKGRENNKLNKSAILNGLTAYAQFGPENPFNYGLTNEEIKNLKADDLVGLLRGLSKYQHSITYYGPKSLDAFNSEVKGIHFMPSTFIPVPQIKKFDYAQTTSNKVYFADYDMVQAEIRWIRNGGIYNPANSARINLFNNYFGGGMGSIVFQTIRESKALAYSTFATYASPNSREKEYTMVAYVGAQADKMNEAITGMNELLTTLPRSEKAFSLSKSNTINSIETGRITKDGIINAYFSDKKIGVDHDSRIDDYAKLKSLTFDDITTFHKENLSGKPYIYCIVASEKKINMSDLAKYGPVSKLTLEEIFGY